MKLGLLSDVHGNRIALEAVLADGRSQGVKAWWALGDLVAIGPDPVPTLELLTSVPNLSVTQENTDRYAVSRDRPPPYPEEVAAKPELLWTVRRRGRVIRVDPGRAGLARLARLAGRAASGEPHHTA